MLASFDIGTGWTHTAVDVPLIIPDVRRFQHIYVVGASGTGKSSVLKRMIDTEAKSGHAIVVFDAGDLIPSLLQSLDEAALQRVEYFSIEHPIPYNPLLRRRNDPGRLENELFSLLDQVTVESSTSTPLTARMKRVLSVGIRAVLREEEPTLSSLATYLLHNRIEIMNRLELYNDDFTVDGVIDRLAQFLRDPRVRRIICAPQALDFDEIIDQGRILLVSLAGLEQPLVRLLGTILNHGLSATVFERPESQRRILSAFYDEFQHYIASDYAKANFQRFFAEGRRHLISMCVAHTDFGAIDRQLLHTIHANADAIIAFACGPDEAETMSRLFGEEFIPAKIALLPDYQAICRVARNIMHITTTPPPPAIRAPLADHFRWEGEDPPDPLEVFANRHAGRNLYHHTRRPIPA
jgi:hypothetical protein